MYLGDRPSSAALTTSAIAGGRRPCAAGVPQVIDKRAQRRGRASPLRVIQIETRERRREFFEHFHEVGATRFVPHPIVDECESNACTCQSQIHSRVVGQDARLDLDRKVAPLFVNSQRYGGAAAVGCQLMHS